MGAQVVFEIDLENLGELSQESVLRAVRLYIDNQVERSSGFGLESVSSYECTSSNISQCVRAWKLSYDQAVLDNLPLSVQSQHNQPRMSLTGEAAVPSEARPTVSATMIENQPLDGENYELPDFESFLDIPAPGPPTYRNELELESRGRTMSRRGRSSSGSRSKDSKLISHRPNPPFASSFFSSSSRPQGTESSGSYHQKPRMKKNVCEGVRKDRSKP